ncbi:hypothetical protein NIES4073_50380 [Kalymmatonema gypsitolerans NIES-4073]|nr:hypothetical protein NIES4073_50380 [Scytonema sp. NIES-4073]
MKKWILTILLPLVLLQSPALAQTDPQDNQTQTQPQTTPPTLAVSKQRALLPLKGTEQIQLNLVNCGGWLGLDCALGRVLLPKSAHIEHRELQFDNPTPAAVNVVNTAVVAQGELTGYQLNSSAISIPQVSKPLPANQIVSMRLVLKRSVMPPDNYNGAVYLTLGAQGDRLTLPINLNVRSGPLLPLVVLFLGVILGRLFKYVQGSGGNQADALKEVNRLDQDIADARLENEDDKKILTGMSGEVRKLVFRDKLDAAKANIEAIQNRLQVLTNLQLIEKRIGEEPLDSTSEKEAREQIEKVRFYIAEKDDAKAKEFLEKLKATLEDVRARSSGDSNIKEYIESAEAATDSILKSSSDSSGKPTPLKRFQRFMIQLSGLSEQVRAEATLWFVRPLLSLTLLLALTALGINSLYVENGKNFGARPFSDYLGLILWGLSADVASRSLSSLQGSNKDG